MRRRSRPARAVLACLALAAGSVFAQGSPDTDEPTIAVTGIGRVLVAPNQAVVSLGATVQRDEAREAQRELDAVMQATVRSIRELGLAEDNLQTATLSLMPVYADISTPASADAARRRDEPRIVAYRATNIVQVTIEDLTMVGAVVDAGIGAGINEIRNISFEVADDLPYRITALERAVEAARQKARAAASALGARLGEPVDVRERSVGLPGRQLDTAFARAEIATPIEPGEIAIEATVDASFRLDAGTAASGSGD